MIVRKQLNSYGVLPHPVRLRCTRGFPVHQPVLDRLRQLIFRYLATPRHTQNSWHARRCWNAPRGSSSTSSARSIYIHAIDAGMLRDQSERTPDRILGPGAGHDLPLPCATACRPMALAPTSDGTAMNAVIRRDPWVPISNSITPGDSFGGRSPTHSKDPAARSLQDPLVSAPLLQPLAADLGTQQEGRMSRRPFATRSSA